MKFVFAGNRLIAFNILHRLINMNLLPSAIILPENDGTGLNDKIRQIVSFLPEELVFENKNLEENSCLNILQNLNLDYIFCIHFQTILKKKILELPKIGVLNLHPAFLPFNKGWHTPSWAILENTPFGASLHYMSEKLDSGDIISQKMIQILPTDTADSLYKRVLNLEEELFFETLDDLKTLSPNSYVQTGKGTLHSKKDLKNIQELNIETNYNLKDLIIRLRALTTNNYEEAAYFYLNEKKIGINITLFEL